MRLSHLEDFVVFAKYMNITRAASELHMTQSNLSKRIRQLEAEVGCELISHGESVSLTPAGLIFLDKITVLLDDYDKILEKTRAASESELNPLLIRTPTWPDLGAAGVVRLANQFADRYPGVRVQFVLRQYQRPLDMISQGIVDAHIVYEYGELTAIKDYYHAQGFLAAPVCEDGLAIWCDARDSFAAKDSISIDDLRHIQIMQITQLYRPLERAVVELCASRDFKPKLVDKTMNSFQEMLVTRSPSAVHLFPLSLREDLQLRSCEDMKLLPVEDAKIHALLITREDSSKTTVELFQGFLSKVGEASQC